MADGARLASAVMFVQDLDRSVRFYTELLGMEVSDRSPTAALLSSPAGAHLILRAMGGHGGHALGAVGIQYVVWTAASQDDLGRCEQVLKKHAAHRETHVTEHAAAVEGRDPDDIVVLIAYPGPDQIPLRELPVRIYGW
jgi:catechol 2,3-dioxygenase-like lactoylglutathione lyase family enzyme